MRREFDLPVYNSSTPLRLTRLKELWRISVNGFTNDEVLSLVAYRWKKSRSHSHDDILIPTQFSRIFGLWFMLSVFH